VVVAHCFRKCQLPDEPPKQFGTSVTGAFEGWIGKPDGNPQLRVCYLIAMVVARWTCRLANNTSSWRPPKGVWDLPSSLPIHFLTRAPDRQSSWSVTGGGPERFRRRTARLDVERITMTVIRTRTPFHPSSLESNFISPPAQGRSVVNSAPPVLPLLHGKRNMVFRAEIANSQGRVAQTSHGATPLPLPYLCDDYAKYTSLTMADASAALPPFTMSLLSIGFPVTYVLTQSAAGAQDHNSGQVIPSLTKSSRRFFPPRPIQRAGEYLLHGDA